jgi:hypothetical protein
MRNHSLQIRPAAIGGYTVSSKYERRARVLATIEAFFHWLGA